MINIFYSVHIFITKNTLSGEKNIYIVLYVYNFGYTNFYALLFI